MKFLGLTTSPILGKILLNLLCLFLMLILFHLDWSLRPDNFYNIIKSSFILDTKLVRLIDNLHLFFIFLKTNGDIIGEWWLIHFNVYWNHCSTWFLQKGGTFAKETSGRDPSVVIDLNKHSHTLLELTEACENLTHLEDNPLQLVNIWGWQNGWLNVMEVHHL